MASANLATIRDKVRKRGDYPKSAVFTDDYVNTEIQTSWSELYELIDDVSEGYWDKIGSVTTVASQAYVALPADHWRLKAVDILDGTTPRPMAQVGIGDRHKFGTSTGMPRAYRTTERGLELYPTPGAGYTIQIVYAPTVPALEEAVARNYWNHWDEYVIVSTLLKLDTREERETAARITELDRAAYRIRSGATKRRQAEPEYLNLRGFDLSDFDGGDF